MPELSQNLKTVLQEVGEGAVLIQLAIRIRELRGWTIYKNYAEDGCDIVIQPTKQRNTVKRPLFIEVKTRQALLTARRHRNAMQFSITANERDACDFVVAYWFERNAFFVVPRNSLRRTRAGDKVLYKFIAYWSDRANQFTAASESYRDRWDLVLERLRGR